MRSMWIVFCLFLASSARAGVVTMAFSASGFGSGAPADPINGTFTWSAASQAAPIDQLLSIDLTIAGHTYGLAEIGFNDFVIGGLPAGTSGVDAGSNADDFLISFNPGLETLGLFGYGVQGITNRIWLNAAGSVNVRFDDGVTVPVPEPGSLALVALAMLGAVSVRRLVKRA